MNRRRNPKWLACAVVTAAVCAHAPIALAQYSSPYRLSIGQADAFRLAGAATEENESPAPKQIPARLADKPFAHLIQTAARDAALDPALVHALISVESAYNPAARSYKGAIGLMQLLPATAARYGIPNPAQSPEANLRAGTRYLRDLIQLFDGRIDLALAAYNAGENAVLRYGQRIPPYPETLKYVPAVLEKYREWQEPPPPAAAPAFPFIEYLPGTRLEKARGLALTHSGRSPVACPASTILTSAGQDNCRPPRRVKCHCATVNWIADRWRL